MSTPNSAWTLLLVETSASIENTQFLFSVESVLKSKLEEISVSANTDNGRDGISNEVVANANEQYSVQMLYTTIHKKGTLLLCLICMYYTKTNNSAYDTGRYRSEDRLGISG
jgi:hypothetical protein